MGDQPYTEEQFESMMQRADTDQDGVLSVKELINFFIPPELKFKPTPKPKPKPVVPPKPKPSGNSTLAIRQVSRYTSTAVGRSVRWSLARSVQSVGRSVAWSL